MRKALNIGNYVSLLSDQYYPIPILDCRDIGFKGNMYLKETQIRIIKMGDQQLISFQGHFVKD